MSELLPEREADLRAIVAAGVARLEPLLRKED